LANGTLKISGEINATSFTLNGGALKTSDISDFNTVIAGIKTDGVSTVTWNGAKYVGLTAASENMAGVLIGTASTDKHLVIPRSSNTTYVDISKAGILFDYSDTNYIHINSSGIEV